MSRHACFACGDWPEFSHCTDLCTLSLQGRLSLLKTPLERIDFPKAGLQASHSAVSLAAAAGEALLAHAVCTPSPGHIALHKAMPKSTGSRAHSSVRLNNWSMSAQPWLALAAV